jgi:hypothetical protein
MLRFAVSLSQFSEHETLHMIQSLKVIRVHVCVFNREMKSFFEKEDHLE